MDFQTSIYIFIGFIVVISECRPQEEKGSLRQIFPMITTHQELPSDGRMIPIKVIHFKNIAIPTVGIQPSSQQSEFRTNYPMAPRGFKDDYDMKSSLSRGTRSQLASKFKMQVPIVPLTVSNSKWVPGELIVSGITRRQVKLIDQSEFGPLRSVTFIPSVQAGIMVFEKRYNPEKLAAALKFLFSIEAEPNGVITTA